MKIYNFYFWCVIGTAITLQSIVGASNFDGFTQDPDCLYKIISKAQWDASRTKDYVVLLNMDKDFIHLARKEQVAKIVEKFWHNTPHLILKLAVKKLQGQLRYEVNPGGKTQYYHLYNGVIPKDAIVEVREVF